MPGISQVFFVPLNDGVSVGEASAAMKKLVKHTAFSNILNPKDFVGVKIHVGEEHNSTHVKPELVKEVVNEIKAEGAMPFLTETSTLYKGERTNAVLHMLHAHKHGFTIDRVGAPFIMADGLVGDSEVEVQVDCELNAKVKIAREAVTADAIICISHPTGHVAASLGAALKNLGMGLASRAGKMRQHSSMYPKINSATCRYCTKCMKWCPVDAIIEKDGRAYINSEICICCGECLAVCRYDSVKYNWGVESDILQKSMVEHAYGVVKGKNGKCYFINVMVDMTQDCDCMSVNQKKLIPDIGILASTDPVAIDKATFDLTVKANGSSLAELSHRHLNPMVQLEHAAKIGMGNLEYEMIQIDHESAAHLK